MHIAKRNFFRLLRAGAFASEEEVEPMSAWKWQQVQRWATAHGVAPLLFDGYEACRDQFFMRLTPEQEQQWHDATAQAEGRYREASAHVAELLSTLGLMQLRPILLEPWTTATLCDRPDHHPVGPVHIFFPFSTQGRKADDWARRQDADATSPRRHTLLYQWQGLCVEHRHRMLHLSNKLSDLALQGIVEQEWLEGGTSHVSIDGHRIETVAPTLALLAALLGIVRTMLTDGILLWQVVDVGILLRKQGDRVDFVKLQGWLDRLHFGRVAQLVGQMLTLLLGFSPDEVPFLTSEPQASTADTLADDLLGNGGTNRAKYYRYCPGESLSSVVASITHSLGNVEE